MRKAYTLIELVVALAIALLLAAILFPVFVRVRAKAQQSTCQSNLRQIGLATLVYVQNNDDRLPGFTAPVPNVSLSIPWTDHLQLPRFRCPVRNNTYACNRVFEGVVGAGLCVDYRYSAGRLIAEVDAQNTVWVADTFPTRTVISSVAELPAWVSEGGMRYGHPFLASDLSSPEAGVVGWHFERANVVFADGHVKAMTLSELGRRRAGRAVWWTKEAD